MSSTSTTPRNSNRKRPCAILVKVENIEQNTNLKSKLCSNSEEDKAQQPKSLNYKFHNCPNNWTVYTFYGDAD